jgi:hypothetical protein
MDTENQPTETTQDQATPKTPASHNEPVESKSTSSESTENGFMWFLNQMITAIKSGFGLLGKKTPTEQAPGGTRTPETCSCESGKAASDCCQKEEANGDETPAETTSTEDTTPTEVEKEPTPEPAPAEGAPVATPEPVETPVESTESAPAAATPTPEEETPALPAEPASQPTPTDTAPEKPQA